MTQEAMSDTQREEASLKQRALEEVEWCIKCYENCGRSGAGALADHLYTLRECLSQPAPDVNLDVAKAKTPEGWKPIETAPKDGTTILLLCSSKTRCNAISSDSWSTAHNEWWRHPPREGYLEPTHWMPLPAAPHSSQGSKEHKEE